MTPRVDESQGGEIDSGKEQANFRQVKKTIDDKFKAIDNLISRKVMKSIGELQRETNTRLESIEIGSIETRETIRKDAERKFSNLKEKFTEEHKEKQDAMFNNNQEFDVKLE